LNVTDQYCSIFAHSHAVSSCHPFHPAENHIRNSDLEFLRLKSRLETAQEVAETHRTEAELLRAQVKELEKTLSTRAELFQHAIKSSDELNSRIRQQTEQIEELRSELLATRAASNKNAMELRTVKQQLSDTTIELEQARADKARLEKLAAEGAAAVTKAAQLESQLELRTRQHEHQVEALQRKLEDALLQIDALSASRNTAAPQQRQVLLQLQNEIARLEHEKELIESVVRGCSACDLKIKAARFSTSLMQTQGVPKASPGTKTTTKTPGSTEPSLTSTQSPTQAVQSTKPAKPAPSGCIGSSMNILKPSVSTTTNSTQDPAQLRVRSTRRSKPSTQQTRQSGTKRFQQISIASIAAQSGALNIDENDLPDFDF